MREFGCITTQVDVLNNFPTLFLPKSAATLVTRIGNGLSGTAPAEAGFYNELRPLFEIEAPFGYYSAAQPGSWRAVHLLEDLVRTRGATFCEPTTLKSPASKPTR